MEKSEETASGHARVRSKVVEKPKPVVVEVEAPKPVLRSDTETVKVYLDLLMKAPDTPMFTSMSEVTEWLDRVYRPWLNSVRHEAPK